MRRRGRRWTFLIGALGLALAIPMPASADCGDGGIAWVRGLASSKSVSLTAIAATTDGGVVAAGEFNEALDVTGAAGKPQGLRGDKEKAGFVLKVSPKGDVTWMRRFTGVEWVKGLAVAKDGTVIVGGSYKRALVFDGPPGARPQQLAADGRDRLFLARYAPDGTPRAVTVAAENAGTNVVTMQGMAVAADAAVASVALTGTYSGDVWFGSGRGRIKLTARPQGDTFAAVIKADGAPVWARSLSADSQTSPRNVAFAPDGSVLVTGTFREPPPSRAPSGNKPGATFGDGRSIVLRQAGDGDAFVARVDAAGKVTWARAIGGDERNRGEKIPGTIMMPATEAIARVVPASDGDLLLVGVSPLPVRFGSDKPLRAAGYSGSFLARLSITGKLRAAVAMGAFDAHAVAPLPGGDLMVVGNLTGIGTLPGAKGKTVSLTSAGRDDLLVARFAADGGLRWASRLGGPAFDSAIDVAADAAGNVTLAARFGRDFRLGPDGCRLVHAGPDDGHQIFLVRLAPGAILSDEAREKRLSAVRDQVAALRKTATQAFKAKRYAAACDTYTKLAAIVPPPDDAAAVADLALCLQRLGKKQEAIAANHRAIALGAKDDLSYWGDDATRRHAYFNLGKLGVTVAMPGEACGKLAPAPGCGRSLWACVDTSKENDSHGGSSRTDWVRIGLTKDDATIADDDQTALIMPSLGRLGLYGTLDNYAFTNNFTSRKPQADVLLGEEVEEVCTRDGCGAPDTEPIDCNVVYADACLGLVGVVCPGAGEGKKGRPRDAVDEFFLGPDSK